MSFTLYTPPEMSAQLADRVRQDRLARGWTQAGLAARSGIPIATYRLFEQTGQISLERLIAISSALSRSAEWSTLFKPRAAQSLDDIDPPRPTRKRGRRSTPSTSR